MIYLLCSIVFMSLANVCQRYSGLAGANAYVVNAMVRVMAGALAIFGVMFSLGIDSVLNASQQVVLWGLLGGVFYTVAGLAAIKTYGLGHLGISSTILRCSMVIPTAASLLFWHEVIFAWNSLSMWLVLGAMVLMVGAIVFSGLDQIRASRISNEPFSKAWAVWLILTFATQGLWEITLRAAGGFEVEQDRQVYLVIVFVTSMVWSLGVLVAVRVKPRRQEIIYGLVLGVLATIGSSVRPMAVRDLSGVIVFPLTAMGTMVLLNIISRLVWKTHLGKWGMVGLAAAVLATTMLCFR